MKKAFVPSEEQNRWASKSRQGIGKADLLKLLIEQEGKCAFSNVEMTFDVNEGTPVKGGNGCHPLYPAVDHIDPGSPNGGHQIVCYALNDLKGHLPVECFEALRKTDAWNKLMKQWIAQANKNRTDRDAFKKLLRPNAKPKNSKRRMD